MAPLAPLGNAVRDNATSQPHELAQVAIQAKENADRVAQEEGGVVTRFPRKFGPEDQGLKSGSQGVDESSLEGKEGAGSPTEGEGRAKRVTGHHMVSEFHAMFVCAIHMIWACTCMLT